MSFHRIGAFKKLISATGRMATLDDIIANNKRGEELLEKISAQLVLAKGNAVAQRKQQLRAENAALLQQVERAKAELIALEVKKGIKQISLPGVRNLCTDAGQQQPQQQQTQAAPTASTDESAKPPKEKKPKKEKPAGEPKKGAPAAAEAELPVDVSRLDMRVGKIIEVGRHPDADSLYLEKIDCGEAQPRTVVSGLVKFVPLEEMQNRMVVVMCNLKPAKMRGVLSEAMVMCASTPDKVEVLSPPAGAVPGDLVHCTGYNRQPDAQLNPKKKIFETCAPDLMTNGELVACYKGAALHVPGKGNVVAQTLKNVNVK